MGLFSSCNHDWHQISKNTRKGLWGDKIQNWHKCSKCNKEEECDEKGFFSQSDDYMITCSKCGISNR